MRYLVAVFMLLTWQAAAQPVCGSAPGAIACLSPAQSPQLTDLILAQQAAGPLRSNQTVQMSLQQILTKYLNTSNAWVSPQTFSGPITAPSYNGNYTVSGPPAQYGENNWISTYNWPISAAGGCCRTRRWIDTVNVTGIQAGSNVLELNFWDLEITGTGTLTGEAFNIIHPYVNIGAGVTISGIAELFEASALNDGTISGTLAGSLNIFTNSGTGTIGNFTAYKTSATNNNIAAGSMANYTGFECGGVTGSGSAPTFNWCMVNRDSTASIVSAGGVRIGGLGNSNGPGTLAINGPDASGGTFPLFIKSTTSNLFYVADDGSVNIPTGTLTVTNNATIGTLTVAGASVKAPLSATSASIGGGALLAGACASTSTTVTGAAVGMAAVATPNTYPGDGNIWLAYPSAANTVTVKVCAVVAMTPTASTYNLRIFQ